MSTLGASKYPEKSWFALDHSPPQSGHNIARVLNIVYKARPHLRCKPHWEYDIQNHLSHNNEAYIWDISTHSDHSNSHKVVQTRPTVKPNGTDSLVQTKRPVQEDYFRNLWFQQWLRQKVQKQAL